SQDATRPKNKPYDKKATETLPVLSGCPGNILAIHFISKSVKKATFYFVNSTANHYTMSQNSQKSSCLTALEKLLINWFD
ncbi:MAG: hypothetical protein Q3990_01995, partial [Desulfovibrionaceae bacterium]|nr:hypothetical protein [Desulfovibrionaceae bacterium]